MITTTKKLCMALNSKSYLEHVFMGIIIKRKWWVLPIICLLVNTFLNYLNLSEDGYLLQFIGLLIILPFVLYLIFALILGSIERTLLNNFMNKFRDEKIKVLKRYFFISCFISFFAFILIVEYSWHMITPFFTTRHIIMILVKILISILFAFFFNNFKKELSKIEENGLL